VKKSQPRARKRRRKELGRPSPAKQRVRRQEVTVVRSGARDYDNVVVVPEKGVGMWDRLLSKTKGRHRHGIHHVRKKDRG
jgi:hypothetical protein